MHRNTTVSPKKFLPAAQIQQCIRHPLLDVPHQALLGQQPVGIWNINQCGHRQTYKHEGAKADCVQGAFFQRMDGIHVSLSWVENGLRAVLMISTICQISLPEHISWDANFWTNLKALASGLWPLNTIGGILQKSMRCAEGKISHTLTPR